MAKELGTKWQIERIKVKQHAAIAEIHCTIECIEEMQDRFPDKLQVLSKIKSVQIVLGETAYHHGG